MLVEKVLGNISDKQFKNKNIDYVDIEWHEAFKKLHKKISQTGYCPFCSTILHCAYGK